MQKLTIKTHHLKALRHLRAEGGWCETGRVCPVGICRQLSRLGLVTIRAVEGKGGTYANRWEATLTDEGRAYVKRGLYSNPTPEPELCDGSL